MRQCGELLYEGRDVYSCPMEWGTEHSHSDAEPSTFATPLGDGTYPAEVLILNGEVAQVNVT